MSEYDRLHKVYCAAEQEFEETKRAFLAAKFTLSYAERALNEERNKVRQNDNSPS